MGEDQKREDLGAPPPEAPPQNPPFREGHEHRCDGGRMKPQASASDNVLTTKRKHTVQSGW